MPSPTASARRSWLVPVLILLVAAALVVVALVGGRSGGQGTAPAGGAAGGAPATEGPVAEVVEPTEAATLDTARRNPDDPLAAGDVDAPVALVVYSDYQCPFCAVWVQDTQPVMMDYVASGDVRIEWRDVNIFGPSSTRGSIAAYAAGLQGRFWEFHDALFAGGDKASESELSQAGLVALADSLGLDVEKFTTDMTDPDVLAAVQANADEGARIGAFSTPSFLIGGRPVVGAQPTEVFVAAVEDALAAAAG